MITSSKTMWTDGPEWEVFQGEEKPALCTSNICHGKGGGGGGQQQMMPTQTTSTVTQSNLPAYAEPYFVNLLNRAQDDVSSGGYVPYGGPRVQDFKEDQYAGINAVRGNQGNWAPFMSAASGEMNQANTAYGTSGGYLGDASGMFNAAGNIGLNTSFDPSAISNTYNPMMAQSGFNPQTISNTFGTGDVQQAQNTYAAMHYTPDNWLNQAQNYMSPYMQNVIDIAKREANRQWDIQGINQNSDATSKGAFGGYRHQVLDAENMKNRMTQLDDIQQKGLQESYSQGMGAFNADRAAAMQGNLYNNQFDQAESELGMRAAGMNNQYNSLASQLGIQAGQLNNQFALSADQQRMMANQLNNQYGQTASQLGMQAADRNNYYDSLAAQIGLQGGQLALGAGQGLTGVGNAYQGIGQGLNALSANRANQGQILQGLGYQDANALLGIGGMHQALDQQRLDTAYQDFINQRDFDRQNLNWLSGILRGVPVSPNSSTTGYMSSASPSTTSQIAGAGLGALGLSKLLG